MAHRRKVSLVRRSAAPDRKVLRHISPEPLGRTAGITGRRIPLRSAPGARLTSTGQPILLPALACKGGLKGLTRLRVPRPPRRPVAVCLSNAKLTGFRIDNLLAAIDRPKLVARPFCFLATLKPEVLVGPIRTRDLM